MSERTDQQVRYDQARYVEDGHYEPLLAEKDLTSAEIDGDDTDSPLPDDLTRDDLELPALSEPELARHYTRLSQMIYAIDTGPYPLGSCTMKYNPKFMEDVAALPTAAVHPDRSERSTQGTLELMYRLQDYLGRIGGMDAVTLQPPAGAAGEFVGIRVAVAYHEHNGESHRNEVIIPESAHGTNFATAALGGYDVVSLPSDDGGRVDLEALEAALSENTAALMLTNPNTLGLFERDIAEIAEMVHDVGGLLYYDGANLNALLGRARPGDMGFDVMHYNVHKTFATPHGGGGPGAGPVGVVDELAPFLPSPRVREADDAESDADEPTYELFDPEQTIGKVHGFQGNWLVLVKTFAYIARLGDEGLTDASAKAVLNANYLASQIDYEVPYGPFHHEFVASAGDQDAADVAKRMLDFGVHPPTTKWPEIVPEALMTEPTEVESKATLDRLAAAFNAVAAEDDETLESAPERTTARRIDQTSAARSPRLAWQALDDE
ncbi:aminomethyl-transferring glycine dehydrogenase subunit GcvPB [Natrarchaeobaculum sulfurireducens]|uniref:glycine dehydrogenase (aminomethyl-transferring) n=1 Tax=Natrarchaeobaculum sulfurireducens TaxID=2044521 RepID=A0A346PDL5_9EURY|nr:aminomethyl-transferring glycine dehydrogenase subunit GcvPB [Natrarchaeobaculum sulfurireducens]AXR77610.1 Glycine cleavage system protein P (pyridoxal-binding), C-terminal domain [Natrarchaeobaculum sulfurireducens]AXR82412.1 Glycine dehydrogenase [decarboxylating] (glycinecleavage system P2 protein) [Natrarchaeobaculum sulfurireducens]